MTQLNNTFKPPAVSILDYQYIHLVGIKGVAMASLAQMLVAAGKTLTGCDVAEHFVTQKHLEELPVAISVGFQPEELPPKTQLVIYTAAHQAQYNPVVQAAQSLQIPTISHAEALASLANTKKTIAVCGVGGKSTTSAMITWILSKMGMKPSYSVGVGSIPGLNSTGDWTDSEYCVVEADEYVTDPTAVKNGQPITPRFSYLQPYVIVCTSLAFDHPDVYQDFDHTKTTFMSFFQNIQPNGYLIINAEDDELQKIAQIIKDKRSDLTLISYGQIKGDYQYKLQESSPHITKAIIDDGQVKTLLSLVIPGMHNVANAVGAVIAAHITKVSILDAAQSLTTFKSTQRRFELRGTINGVTYFDDYAHHPREIAAVLHTVQSWKTTGRVVIAFQPHTFSRTKQLFSEFTQILSHSPELVLLDIFASAREAYDPSITSDILVQAIKEYNPNCIISNLGSVEGLAIFCQAELHPGDTLITLGAGDIYHVYNLIT